MITTARAKEAMETILDAEPVGVRQPWTTQGSATVDALIVLTVGQADHDDSGEDLNSLLSWLRTSSAGKKRAVRKRRR